MLLRTGAGGDMSVMFFYLCSNDIACDACAMCLEKSRDGREMAILARLKHLACSSGVMGIL